MIVENKKLKEEIKILKLENSGLRDENNFLKDQIISMTKEFVDSLTQLNEWFRSQING
ncbi:MAG: hypothetical protein KC444_06935 [Nitrosopumilus sp.]|nr:hypothetical protein [Nitrosopumilus sp.]